MRVVGSIWRHDHSSRYIGLVESSLRVMIELRLQPQVPLGAAKTFGAEIGESHDMAQHVLRTLAIVLRLLAQNI